MTIELKSAKIAAAPEVEKSIIGALMLDNESFQNIAGILTPEMFYSKNTRQMFTTICEMHRNNESFDLPSLTTKLRDFDLIGEIGGMGFLMECLQNVTSSGYIEKHAEIVARKYIHREIITTANSIIDKATEDASLEEISQVWQSFEVKADQVFTGGEVGTDSRSAIMQTLKLLEEEAALFKKGILPGIQTGFPTLDQAIGGFQKGKSIVLAGRPGEGKTSLALIKFMTKAAEQGKNILFFSYEMTIYELNKILLSAKSQVFRVKIRDANLSSEDWQPINQAAEKISNYSIRWFENPYLTIDQVTAIVKKYKRLNKVDFVIIDYLQLINSNIKTQYREQEVANITRKLKALANSEKIPVLTLAQLNRQDFGEDGPTLKHLRESGSIEQDADIVLFVWKPSVSGGEYEFQENELQTLKLKIAKNRNGILTTFEICENGEMTGFREKLTSFEEVLPDNIKSNTHEIPKTKKLPF